MTFNSVGDLALSIQLRRQNSDLKANLNRLSGELSSGVSSNLSTNLRGNFSALAGLERGISIADSYLVGIAEKRLDTSIAQSALEKIRSLGQISSALLTVQETSDPTLVRNSGGDALARFAATLQTLNTQGGGRSIFAGITPDSPAVADVETIMAALEAEITLAGADTAETVAAVVDSWFDAGGGYDTVGYLGDVASAFGTKLSATETAPDQITAQDPGIRNFLSELAKGALVGRGSLQSDPDEQGRLARLSGEGLIAAEGDLIDLKASIGIVEAQTERANVEVRAELQAFEIAKNELISVDPFETAVKLENAQLQLETLYSVTARLSGLSLVNYL